MNRTSEQVRIKVNTIFHFLEDKRIFISLYQTTGQQDVCEEETNRRFELI